MKQHECSPAKMTAFEALNAASNGGIGYESTSNHVTENSSSPQKLPPRMNQDQHALGTLDSKQSLYQPRIVEMANKATTPYKSNSSINFDISEHKVTTN